MTAPRENPFRIDRVSALPFIFPNSIDGDALADRFARLGRAAIVGPHGVGKSTLLRSIADRLAERGEPVLRLALPGSAMRREQQAVLDQLRPPRPDAAVFIDGYEQLSRWRRHLIHRQCARLLVTAHAVGSLPTLIELRPTLQTLDAVLLHLLGGRIPPAITDVAHAAFARTGGNLRESLFALYDTCGGVAGG